MDGYIWHVMMIYFTLFVITFLCFSYVRDDTVISHNGTNKVFCIYKGSGWLARYNLQSLVSVPEFSIVCMITPLGHNLLPDNILTFIFTERKFTSSVSPCNMLCICRDPCFAWIPWHTATSHMTLELKYTHLPLHPQSNGSCSEHTKKEEEKKAWLRTYLNQWSP